VERDKPKKSESVGQTLPQLPWKQKKGDLKYCWIPFIKLHETLLEYPLWCVAAFWGLKKFKMAATAMVTKVQNGHQIQKSSNLGKIWLPSRL
jgi:hypothetical protein